jgi:phosphoribosyl 1,2-cyclic phosphate phosphodiesterase
MCRIGVLLMKLTFLGTGTSFGVPQLGCHCAVCRSPDPRDRRTRVGAVVETKGGTRILVVSANEEFMVGDASVLAVSVPHGPWTVFGYRIGPLAYITDAKTVPADVVAALRGVEVLVINALFRTEHPTHLSIPEAIEVARSVAARRTYLTHLTHENFHADLEAELLPRGVTPAFDGLTVRIDT